MKRMLLVTMLLYSLVCYSQTSPKPKNEPKEDSITNQTVFHITVDELNKYADKLKDQFTQRQWEVFMVGLQSLINDMVVDKKNKQKPLK